MGLYSGGLIIGRIFAPEIGGWGGGSVFSGGLIFGEAYYQNFTVYIKQNIGIIRCEVEDKGINGFTVTVTHSFQCVCYWKLQLTECMVK